MSLPSRDYAEALSPNCLLLCDRIKAETFVPVKPYPPQSRITEACETDTFSCRAGGDGGGQTRSTLQGHAGCGGGGGGGGASGLYLNTTCMQKNCVCAPCGEAESHTDTPHPWTPNIPQHLGVWEVLPLVTRTVNSRKLTFVSFCTKVESLSMSKSLRLCLVPSKIPLICTESAHKWQSLWYHGHSSGPITIRHCDLCLKFLNYSIEICIKHSKIRTVVIQSSLRWQLLTFDLHVCVFSEPQKWRAPMFHSCVHVPLSVVKVEMFWVFACFSD